MKAKDTEMRNSYTRGRQETNQISSICKSISSCSANYANHPSRTRSWNETNEMKHTQNVDIILPPSLSRITFALLRTLRPRTRSIPQQHHRRPVRKQQNLPAKRVWRQSTTPRLRDVRGSLAGVGIAGSLCVCVFCCWTASCSPQKPWQNTPKHACGGFFPKKHLSWVGRWRAITKNR